MSDKNDVTEANIRAFGCIGCGTMIPYQHADRCLSPHALAQRTPSVVGRDESANAIRFDDFVPGPLDDDDARLDEVPAMPDEPSTIERLADEMKDMFASKNADYAGKAGRYSNFERAAIIAEWFEDPIDKVFATMLGIKLARLAILKAPGKTPNNESVEDSHADFFTYAAIWAAWEIDRKATADEFGAYISADEAIGSHVPKHAL